MNKLSLLSATSLFVAISFGSAVAESPSTLLKEVEKKTQSLRSFHFLVTDERTFGFSDPAKAKRIPPKDSSTVDLTFMRPNRFRAEEHESNFPGTFQTISDGTSLFSVHDKKYTKSEIDSLAANFHWFHNDLVLLYVTGTLKKAIDPPYPPKLKQLPDETWKGDSYKVLGVHVGGGVPIDYKLWIGKDLLVHRLTHTEGDEVRTLTLESSLGDLQVNSSVAADDFVFKPGPDLTATAPIDYYKDNPQISVGALASNFSLPTPSGRRLSLAESLSGKKCVLLNFWFVGCPPCRAEHPKLERMYGELKDKGFGLIAVDDQDSASLVAKYLKSARLDFPTVLSGPMAAIDPKTGYPNYRGPKLPDYASLTPYGIHECPTNVLIDSNMRVVYVSNEWNETALRKKLQELGVE